uniref:Periplasmic solute binding protein n=1 Tax=uncultured bacterium Contigcl_1792 TaxID=1393663 RepID=W0FRT8_9BACT|nr:periplasmic solute binding protein [uncultured bacterium Contigcl_1792]
MKKISALILTFLLLFPLLAGAETVVTSFYPVWLLTRALTEGVEGVETVNLTGQHAGCLHDYTLQHSDMIVLSHADALFINGAGMEPFLPVITGAYPDLPVVDATDGLPFLTESGVVEIGEPEDGEAVNSHLWMDPQRAAGMAANLAEGLIRLLPDQAQLITENLDHLREGFTALDETLRDGLKDAGRKVIIFHEAFPYFAEAGGLQVAAIVNKEHDDDLPAASLTRILSLIGTENELPVIIKSAETDRSVDVLVSEAGVPVCVLDPMTSGPDDPPMDYYETVMIRNMQLLQEAMK